MLGRSRWERLTRCDGKQRKWGEARESIVASLERGGSWPEESLPPENVKRVGTVYEDANHLAGEMLKILEDFLRIKR